MENIFFEHGCECVMMQMLLMIRLQYLTFRSVLDQLLSDTVYMLASRGIIRDQQLVRGELRIDGVF